MLGTLDMSQKLTTVSYWHMSLVDTMIPCHILHIRMQRHQANQTLPHTTGTDLYHCRAHFSSCCPVSPPSTWSHTMFKIWHDCPHSMYTWSPMIMSCYIINLSNVFDAHLFTYSAYLLNYLLILLIYLFLCLLLFLSRYSFFLQIIFFGMCQPTS